MTVDYMTLTPSDTVSFRVERAGAWSQTDLFGCELPFPLGLPSPLTDFLALLALI